MEKNTSKKKREGDIKWKFRWQGHEYKSKDGDKLLADFTNYRSQVLSEWDSNMVLPIIMLFGGVALMGGSLGIGYYIRDAVNKGVCLSPTTNGLVLIGFVIGIISFVGGLVYVSIQDNRIREKYDISSSPF